MTNKYQPLRGMKDLLPEQYYSFENIINIARTKGELYGYKPIATPLLENIEIFYRGLGETSDVISKEIYNFVDKGGNHVALRPEFTASIMRSVISNNSYQTLPIKYFSFGPLFRYDRPQAGRFRQFHQINFEYIGAQLPTSDAEIIKLAYDILCKLGIKDDITLEINSLGCQTSINNYQAKLVEYFSNYSESLSQDSQNRLLKNPLRILDSKDPKDKEIVLNAPLISESYTDEARKYFEQVLNLLDLLEIKYKINPRLVRGLDYYSHTIFEFTTGKLGSQSTVLAGGRYDKLSKIMGGPDLPAIGFAAGIERLALLCEYSYIQNQETIILPITENDIEYAFLIANKLRDSSVFVTLDFSGKIGKRMQRANGKARFVIFIGEEERLNGNLKLKDMLSHNESIMDLLTCINYIKTSYS